MDTLAFMRAFVHAEYNKNTYLFPWVRLCDENQQGVEFPWFIDEFQSINHDRFQLTEQHSPV